VVRAWPEVTNRTAQLKALGNSIVPQCAMIFAQAISKNI
jgi:site-specific DNA-cytosine methylase